jgi:hypothetical protein
VIAEVLGYRASTVTITRDAVLAATLAAAHFVTTGTLGVVAFLLQGNLTSPDPPGFPYLLVSGVVDVLEFPLVAAVRWLGPETLPGFLPAAIGNSILWGGIATMIVALARRVRASSSPG